MKSAQQTLFSGLLFIFISLMFGINSLINLPLGSFSSMGPGSVPLLLSTILLFLGVLILISGIKEAKQIRSNKEKVQITIQFRWKPLLYVLGANFVFGLTLKGVPSLGIPACGLIISIYASVFMASLASPQHNHRQTMILATLLAAACYLIFIRLIGITVPVWPGFFN